MRKAHRLILQLIEPFQPTFQASKETDDEKRLLLVRLRWAVILIQVLLFYPALKLEYLLPELVPHYVGLTLALALFNVWAPSIRSRFLQLSVDLFNLCAALIITAGCHNPFASFVFVSAILGPMFLSKRQSLIYLAMTSAGLTTVCLYTEPVLTNAAGHVVSPVLTITAKIIVLFLLGALTMWLKACLDRSQERYEKLYKQRQRLNNFRAVGVVAAQLSHEISTPLNTMKLMMDKMERKSEAGLSSELKVAKAALAQCEGTVRNLFDCGVDADSLSYKETEVVDFIRSVAERWQSEFPSAKVALDVGQTAYGIHYRLPVAPFAQALMDLLDNAMDASEGKGPVEIDIAIATESEALSISISDKGAGLDPSIAARLGEPFVSSKSTGTGLGLYNALSLIEALGGHLGLKPRLGGGTQVQMVLPL